MLELYWAYADYGDIMELTEQLVAHLALKLKGSTVISYGGRELDLAPPWRRARLVDLLAEHSGLEVGLDTPLDDLRSLCADLDIPVESRWGPGKLILELYEKTTEAELWGPVFVCDYPLEVSPLAREHRDHPGWVERFEAIVAGLELANAFSELTDPDEQRAASKTRRPTGMRATPRPWMWTGTICERWSSGYPQPAVWEWAWIVWPCFWPMCPASAT